MQEKTTPATITRLNPNEILVFGSSTMGSHAKTRMGTHALNFGARNGVWRGFCGNTYAIKTLTVDLFPVQYDWQVSSDVAEFLRAAESLPMVTFLVTHIGGDSEYYTPKKIAPMFAKAADLPNVHLPAEYWQVLNNLHRMGLTPSQKKVLQLAKDMGGTVVSSTIVEALGGAYYSDAEKYVGDIVSRMVKTGLLIQVKPGVFRIPTADEPKKAKAGTMLADDSPTLF